MALVSETFKFKAWHPPENNKPGFYAYGTKRKAFKSPKWVISENPEYKGKK